MNPERSGGRWRGLLASFLLTGAGQFLAGARMRGLLWYGGALFGSIVLLLLYVSFLPGWAGIVFLLVALLAWIIMLCDAWRPVPPLRWWGWLCLLVLAFALDEVVSGGAHLLFRAFHIPTASMSPTLIAGDDVMLARYAYWFSRPQRGDIVVFETRNISGIAPDPAGRTVYHEKRVIGLPGDHIELLQPGLRINGSEVSFGELGHPIAYYGRHPETPDSLTSRAGHETYIVPEGQYFVLGDNSRNSFDSRYYGSIPGGAIYGKITKIYWPLRRAGAPP